MIIIENILETEKYINDVDAVVFDLDDTLYSEKEYVKSGYTRIAEHFNMPQMANEMWEVFKQGGYAVDVVFERYGLLEYKGEALKIYRFHNPSIMLYPGVAEMLERIKQSKKIGIVTDGRPEGQRAKIEALKIKVDEVIITDQLGGVAFRKPNASAFIIMRDRLKVAYNKMVYVGDNTNKDFIAPQKLGMKCIWFNNKDGLYC